jgi:hypothetical protein
MTDLNDVVDLDDLNTTKACNSAYDLEITHPVSKKPLGVFIPIVGRDGDAYREHLREQVDAKLIRDWDAGRKGKDPLPPSIERQEDELLDSLTVCIMASGKPWYTVVKDNNPDPTKRKPDETLSYIKMGGQKLDWNVPNIRRVLKEQLFIRRQVDTAVGDLELFMKTSAAT